MIPSAFEYRRAGSVDEAIALKREAGSAARFIAGGHSLIPLMKLRLSEPSVLIDIGRVPGLSGVSEDGGRISIGALTTHADLESDPLLLAVAPIVAEAAGEIGDQQVRNPGTIGGGPAPPQPGTHRGDPPPPRPGGRSPGRRRRPRCRDPHRRGGRPARGRRVRLLPGAVRGRPGGG